MTMKQVLHCALMLIVLSTSGCGFLSDESTARPNANSSPTPQTEKKISAQPSPVKPINETKETVQKRGTDNSRADSPKINDNAKDSKNEANRDPGSGAESLDNANANASLSATTTSGPTSPAPESPVKTDARSGFDWQSILIWTAEIILGLLAVVLLATAISYLWKRAWRTVEFNVGQVVAAHLAANRDAQPDNGPKLASLSSAQAEMSSRLNELDTEVRSLARLVRESLATRRPDRNPSDDGFNYHSPVEDVVLKEEPEFPVSAVDYLGKMDRFANVVRPDFQNGILVNAPDGDGELVLIRDSRDETQPLFVVPRATQFQTKQDFYTYYQKYYDCVRPSAGAVWIIGPAVVERVSGGWQLREKGMLEVR